MSSSHLWFTFNWAKFFRVWYSEVNFLFNSLKIKSIVNIKMLDFHFGICNQILIELSDGNLWHNYFSSNLQALEYCLNHVACINTKEWKVLWCLKKLSLVPIEKWIKQVSMGIIIITVIRRFESGCFKSFQPLSFALMTR